MAFGNPYKYVYLDPDNKEQDDWDSSIHKADERFRGEEHNLIM
jgi:hypothetical protein